MFIIFRELSASLNMPIALYQTGIKRDPSNYKVFRRVSDGEVVQLEGWLPGRRLSNDGFDFLVWNLRNGSYKNVVYNTFPAEREFICEYF